MTDPEQLRRRRRALELLGELEPSRAEEDNDEGWGESSGGSQHDDELRRNVPPHHG